jgi:hypothetical protein
MRDKILEIICDCALLENGTKLAADDISQLFCDTLCDVLFRQYIGYDMIMLTLKERGFSEDQINSSIDTIKTK